MFYYFIFLFWIYKAGGYFGRWSSFLILIKLRGNQNPHIVPLEDKIQLNPENGI